MSILTKGEYVMVRYSGHPLWHERLVLARVGSSNSCYVIGTPDEDKYIEDFGRDNTDIDGFKRFRNGNQMPAGIPPGQSYRFRQRPSGAELAEWFREGAEIAETEAERDFNDNGDDGPPLIWMALESRGEIKKGEVIKELSTDAIIDGDRAIHKAGSGPLSVRVVCATVPNGDIEAFKKSMGFDVVDDARTLAVKVAGDKRYREFREATGLMGEVPFTDWPIAGPRTVSWCLTFLQKKGGPMLHHEWWRTTCHLSMNDVGVGEHENTMRALEDAICYDQIDVTNHAGYEHIVRKAQLWEYFYKEKTRQELASSKDKNVVDLEEQNIFLGVAGVEGSLMICPALTEWVSKELERLANIEKQSRKAREERALRRR